MRLSSKVSGITTANNLEGEVVNEVRSVDEDESMCSGPLPCVPSEKDLLDDGKVVAIAATKVRDHLLCLLLVFLLILTMVIL